MHTGQDWLDPTTSRVMFEIVNIQTAKILRPVSGPWFFRRVRLLAGGQMLEDIDYYNRVHEMMEILTAKDSRENEAVEGFGYVLNQQSLIPNATFNGPLALNHYVVC